VHTAVTSLRADDGQGRADGEAVAAQIDGAVNGLNQAVKEGLDLGKLRILVVEDNLINQTVLQRQLTKTGWQSDGECAAQPSQLFDVTILTSVASNGQEALDRLTATNGGGIYDAILMDLEMPSKSRNTTHLTTPRADR